MAYPKPLSQKSLERLYAQSSLSAEALEVLHRFFAACARLYGAIEMRHMWEIYQQLENVPKLRRKDLLAFSSIVRREKQPYYMFEVEELYSEEPHQELSRFVVIRELITVGYGNKFRFYGLMEQIDGRPYYIPDDFLSYADPVCSPQEKAIRDFLSGLVSTADECVPHHQKPYPNENRGKRLDAFSFLNSTEQFEIKWLEKQPSALAAFREECAGTEAEKIVRHLLFYIKIGNVKQLKLIEWLSEELLEVGVQISRKQMEELLRLEMELNNHTHMWCRSGWAPCDVTQAFPPNGPLSISFGPGIQQAFQDGSLDRTDLIGELQKMGIKVSEQ